MAEVANLNSTLDATGQSTDYVVADRACLMVWGTFVGTVQVRALAQDGSTWVDVDDGSLTAAGVKKIEAGSDMPLAVHFTRTSGTAEFCITKGNVKY